jgi:hypothetical protein
MSDISHIHVRQLEIADFDFVRQLASKQSNFTVPPPYILWLFLRLKGAICLVAEESERGLVGYLLALPVEPPEASIFVWQLAASHKMPQSKIILALLREFRKKISESHVFRVLFSSVPNSVVYRAVRHYAWEIFASVPTRQNMLPSSIDANEAEFILHVSKKTSVRSNFTVEE